MMKKIYVSMLLVVVSACGNELPLNQGGVESVLFLGKGYNQPLVVGLGGSEGGNPWASNRWKPVRDKFIKAGYAFLALGYFGSKGTPEQLDRISIEAVHEAIMKASKNSRVNSNKIAIMGGSKGAELALLLASYYDDINCVVAMVPGHCAFPALTLGASTSSWTYQRKEVPFVPTPWEAVPAIIKRDLREAFTIMLRDTVAVQQALIKVENINGPVLLISAKRDEMWPSKEMGDAIMNRLATQKFRHVHEHIIDEGGHMEVLDYFDNVLTFLEKNFHTHQPVQ